MMTVDTDGDWICDESLTGLGNLIIGVEYSYTSYGGLIAGSGNTISGSFASVTGGEIRQLLLQRFNHTHHHCHY